VPIVTMPITTNDSIIKPVNTIATPSAKRPRTDSPTNHQQAYKKPTLTLDQLKLQYGNMNVNKKIDVCIFIY
jgi:hypothetical protein